MLNFCCICRKDNNNLNVLDSKINLISSPLKYSNNKIKKELFNITSKNNNETKSINKNINKDLNNNPIIIQNQKAKEIIKELKDFKNEEKKTFKNNNNINSRNKKNLDFEKKYFTESPCENLRFIYSDEKGDLENKKSINNNNSDLNFTFFKKNTRLGPRKNYSSSIKSIPKIKLEKNLKFKMEEKQTIKKVNVEFKRKEKKDKGDCLTLKSCKLENLEKKVKKLNPPPNLSKFKHRQSVMNYETIHLNKIGNVKKSCSVLSIFEQNGNIIENKILKYLSKKYKILNRESLLEITYIKNLKNINTENNFVDSEGKGKINLYLENLKGEILLDKLIIGPLGLIKFSRRKAKDTITFFGYSEQKDYNDYILNNTSFIYNNKTFTKTLFAFSYDINCQKYFIQPILDNNKGGRFILINISDNGFSFINNKAVVLNKTIIYIIPSNNGNFNNLVYNLKLRIYEENETKGTEVLINNVENGQELRIGYNENDRIKIKYLDGINKQNYCSIVFDKEKEIWNIKGNNAWLVLSQKYNIKEETLIKIGEDIIKINIAP